MKKIELNSPAKINLSLAITGRRADGFHDLISLVAPLEFGDRVSVKSLGRKGGISLECDMPGVPTDESNLAVKAAERFRDTFGIEDALSIRLDKRIPAGAGLGGGSSNAAAILEALSQMYGIGDVETLFGLAAEIGSDCPLFLKRRPVVMRGRGEIIEELPESAQGALAGLEIILFKPSFSIPTKWAYQSLATAGDMYADREDSEARLNLWLAGELPLEELLSNTLESVADNKFPALPIMRESIRKEFGLSCLMSGSGSCNFALGEGRNSEHLEARIREAWGKRCFFEATKVVV